MATFPQDLEELRSYFRPGGPGNGVHASPGEGLDVPIYILGSSDFGARRAAALGLPFAFASHFAPDALFEALALYRRGFEPSEVLAEPYAIVGVNVIAADNDEQARRLFTSIQQAFLNLARGTPRELQPPVASMDGRWNAAERAQVERMTRVSAVGSPATVRARLEAVLAATRADEVIATAHVYDHAARLRSFELAATAFADINAARRRGPARQTDEVSTPRRGSGGEPPTNPAETRPTETGCRGANDSSRLPEEPEPMTCLTLRSA